MLLYNESNREIIVGVQLRMPIIENKMQNHFKNEQSSNEKKVSQQLEENQLEDVAGGNNEPVPNPLMVMLNMYYHIAMEETDPAAKAKAVREYNQTLNRCSTKALTAQVTDSSDNLHGQGGRRKGTLPAVG